MKEGELIAPLSFYLTNKFESNSKDFYRVTFKLSKQI